MVVFIWWQVRGSKIWGRKYCFPRVNAACPSAFFYVRELLFENTLEDLAK